MGALLGLNSRNFIDGLAWCSDLNELVKYVFDGLTVLFGFVDPLLIIADGDRYLIKHSAENAVVEKVVPDDSKRSLLKYVARQNLPVNRLDYPKGRLISSLTPEYDDQYAFCAVIPLRSLQHTSGFLLVNHKVERRPLNPELLEFFNVISVPLGLALDAAMMGHAKSKLDPETGLLRKNIFFNEFSQELRRTAMVNRPLTLGILEFEHWSELENVYGETACGELDISAGNLLRNSTRAGDMIFRFGHGRFVVILVETPHRDGEKVIARLKGVLEKLQPAWELRVVSGTSEFPSHGDTSGRLFSIAERNLN